MAGDGNKENTAVKRHDRKHHQVRQSRAHRIHASPKEPRSDLIRSGLDDAAIIEPLNDHRQSEDEDQGQSVHARAGTRPALEENFGFVTPVEGHVGDGSVVDVNAAAAGGVPGLC